MSITHDGGAVEPVAIRKDFGFIGRLSLDFAQTGDMGFGKRFERLINPGELRRWLSLSPLQLEHVHVSSLDLARALRLRGAIWRVASAVIERLKPAGRDIRLLNAEGRHPPLVKTLDSAARRSAWYRPTARAALSTIAQDAIDLFGDAESRKRLRRCENPHCRSIFYDDSRPGLRRWCASNRCGDRLRAQAYRERQRSG